MAGDTDSGRRPGPPSRASLRMCGTLLAWAAASLTSLAAPPETADAVHLRLLVKLTHPAMDVAALARQAAAIAGTEVRHVAATSPQWHALELSCADAKQCEAAEMRLRAESATFEIVERDARRKPLAPPGTQAAP